MNDIAPTIRSDRQRKMATLGAVRWRCLGHAEALPGQLRLQHTTEHNSSRLLQIGGRPAARAHDGGRRSYFCRFSRAASLALPTAF